MPAPPPLSEPATIRTRPLVGREGYDSYAAQYDEIDDIDDPGAADTQPHEKAGPALAPARASDHAAQRPTWQMPSLSAPERGSKRRTLALGTMAGIAIASLAFAALSRGPNTGALRLVVEPGGPGTRLTVGGQTMAGTSGAAAVDLVPGRYDILVQRTGFADWTGDIVLEAGERHTVHVSLRARPAPQPAPAVAAPVPSRPAAAPVPRRKRASDAGVKQLSASRPLPSLPQVPAGTLERVSGQPPVLRDNDRAAARVCIDPQGRVTNVTSVRDPRRSSSRRFRKELRAWRFRPFRRDGRAVPVCTLVSFET